jgi:hypothetical protein
MSLIILCASHLKTEQNVEQMREMLDSQMNQTSICDIYVSYTGLSLEYDDPRVHLIKQPEPQLAQFQHYKRLVRTLWDAGILHSENYAIFTDDDDIMDPERNAAYLKLIRAGIEVVRIDKSVIRFSMDCDINEHATSLQSAVLKSGIILDYMNPSEYVDLCLKGDVLMEFLQYVDGEKYVCDCDFNHRCCIYICNNPKVCIEVVAKKPLYYYRYSMFRGVRHKYLEEVNNSVD